MKDKNYNPIPKQSKIRKDRTQAKQRFFNSTAIAYSEKFNCVSILESKLEQDFYTLMLFESIDDFRTQPQPLKHLVDEKVQNYTPDATYIKDGEQYVVEIKPYKKTQSDDFKSKVQFLTTEYLKKGMHFKVITEKEIYDGCNIENLSMLSSSLRFSAPTDDIVVLKTYLNPHREYTISELNQIAIDAGLSPVIVRRAIAHRLFFVDITVPYSDWKISI